MKEYKTHFRGKRITLLGLGLLGRGVGDAEFLAACGAEVTVTDKKSEEELAESVARLKKYPNITFHLGGHQKRDFEQADLVIKSAGVRLDSPEVAAARAAGVPVAMSTALFAKYAMEAGATIVGVTGTRGKTTVTHMIHHCLKSGLKTALVGGNVRGLSTLAMLPEVTAETICVLELDSWQLQGFGDLRISPQVAVFTNLMPDHQNYYKDMDEYFEDKANIFKYQKAGDTLIIGKSVRERLVTAHPAKPLVPEALPPEWKLRIVGEHNRENASFAAAALRALGIPEEEIRAGLESFEPIEGRLQFLRELNGIKIYNDNNATTPEATIAALRSLGKGVTLIVGGSEKGLELEELVSEIKKCVSRVVLLTHPNYKGSLRLAESLREAGVSYEEASDLSHAVAIAMRNMETGTLLFSPAFASFGMFKNEYDRNDQFVELVRRMGGEA